MTERTRRAYLDYADHVVDNRFCIIINEAPNYPWEVLDADKGDTIAELVEEGNGSSYQDALRFAMNAIMRYKEKEDGE